MRKNLFIIIFVLVIIGIGIGWQYTTEKTVRNGNTPTSADNAPPGSIHNLPVPDAVAAVRTHVANELNVNEGVVIVMTAYEKIWTNGCLNLAEIDESCTEALVSGWEVVVQVQGKEFIYHTNSDGTALRQK